ncbi:hypothetical protein A8E25_32255 [Burkholderia cenocepacia]|nr:hypothetical protein BURCENK562V_C0954 [Burkholderia cenocepacia K56-2Valvano]ERI24949.1 hypothetical protein BURCENBC7_AP7402 [Burkholderia cenocepacia BC7]ONR49198.1 hypothetical protein A8E17_36165 [Burkholderia cenocepacia]ONR60220.1 hypothetical protein A8E23_33340 [Burkholderia cenocepacia]ONR66818.1 hypothetical protein A8E18_25285 [Burkholderia cenocepacia]
MGGALNDTRRRVPTRVAEWRRRIVSCAGIHSPDVRVAARPTPRSRPSHGARHERPAHHAPGSHGRVDTTACPLVIK